MTPATAARAALLCALCLAACQTPPAGSCTALDAKAKTLEPACQYHAMGSGVDVQLRTDDSMTLFGVTLCSPDGWHCTITMGPDRFGPCVLSHEIAHARLWDARGGADAEHEHPGWGAGECLYDEWSRPWTPDREE